MFYSFTWQQFLIAALVFTSTWYVTVLLLFYRKRVKSFFPKCEIGNRINQVPLSHVWEEGEEYKEFNEEETLIGESKLPEGVLSVPLTGFSFAEPANPVEDRLGLVPDILEEVKHVFSIIKKENGSKEEFFSLLQLIKAQYSQILESPLLDEINQLIINESPVKISIDELESFWNQ